MSDLMVVYAIGCLITFIFIGWNLDTISDDYHMTLKTVICAWFIVMYWPTAWVVSFADSVWSYVRPIVKRRGSAK